MIISFSRDRFPNTKRWKTVEFFFEENEIAYLLTSKDERSKETNAISL